MSFFTASESQFCQALRGYNGMTVAQKLLESEQLDCRGAGLVQTTSRVLMDCGGGDGFDGGFDGFDRLDGFDGSRAQCWNPCS